MKLGAAAPFPVADHWAICSVAHGYSHALGRRDWVALGRCFADDATMDLSADELPAQGRDAIVATIRRNMASFQTLQQNLGTPVIDIDPATGTASARFYIFSHYLVSGDHPGTLRAGGVYDDVYVRRHGIWWISSRRIRVRWIIGDRRRIRASILEK